MLVRNFVPGQESPGVLATGSSQRPYVGTYGEAGSPLLTQMIGIKSNIDYGENSDYPETDYGRAFTHFYGFNELRPQGESLLGSDTISGTLTGDMGIFFDFDVGGKCHSAKACGDGIVYRGPRCGTGDIEAAAYDNRPYMYAPPRSALSFARWAGGAENGETQNLELAEGGWFGFTQYHMVEPGAGPKSGEEYLDNSQEHPLLLVDGEWKVGNQANNLIVSAKVYDPSTFDFVEPADPDLTPGHAWTDDFDDQTVVTEDANEIMLWLRPWPDIAQLSTGFAHQTKAPTPIGGYDTMNMLFYPVKTDLSVPAGGELTQEETYARGLAYTRFRLHPEYDGSNPLVAPWGDIETYSDPASEDSSADEKSSESSSSSPSSSLTSDSSQVESSSSDSGTESLSSETTPSSDSSQSDWSAGGAPGYRILDEEEDFGCRSINETFDGPEPGSEIVTCLDNPKPVLGFALYMRMDETQSSFINKFGFTYGPDYSGVRAWGNFIRALHEYEFDPDEGEWYQTLDCESTTFAVQTGGGGGTHEYLFDNLPAVELPEVFTCGQDGYGVLWPTPDNPAGFLNVGPPDSWGCDDGFELDGGECDWPYGDGRSNVKMVTEIDERTWDFLGHELYDAMLVKDEYVASDPCTKNDTLAWYYCACRCPNCGDFFFFDMERLTYLFSPSGDAPCGEDEWDLRGNIYTAYSVEEQTIDLPATPVLPGWYRFALTVAPEDNATIMFSALWQDYCVLLSAGICSGEIGTYEAGTFDLVLENADTEKEGSIYLGPVAIGGIDLGGEFGLGPYWTLSDIPKIAPQHTCDDAKLFSYCSAICGSGGTASRWLSSILNQTELDYEDPHRDPLADFEPNGSVWQLKELQIRKGMTYVTCGGNREMYDAICSSEYYSSSSAARYVCASSGEEQIGLGCIDTPEPFCLPQPSGVEVDTITGTFSQVVSVYFRGLS